MIDESENTSSSEHFILQYIKEEYIGKGGFGVVYKGRHRYLNKGPVCIKVNRPDKQSEELTQELIHEANILASLKHDHIVPLVDLFPIRGEFYMIMTYIDGGDLSQVLSQTKDPFPIDEINHMIAQIADGLHFVHQNNIIHRDLKPQNILRDTKGNYFLADFGIAKVLDTMHGQAPLASQSIVGTKPYMAPEQFEGKADYRSDLYSLGVITFQLLTRRLPLPYDENYLQKGLPSLRDLNPKVTPEIEQVVFKMLARDPTERYQTSIEFQRAFHSAVTKKHINLKYTNPQDIHKDLEALQDGQVMSLDPGEYKGPLTLNKGIRLIGAGALTKIYTIDEPVLSIHANDVLLENMVIQRTRESIETVIQADRGISYKLRHVTISGGPTLGAEWEDAEWQLPFNGIDFGRIPAESIQERQVAIEVKKECTVETQIAGLEVFPLRCAPGAHTLKLKLNAKGKPPGTAIIGSVRLQHGPETREIPITGKIEQLTSSIPTSLTMEWSYRLTGEATQPFFELGNKEEQNLYRQWQRTPGDAALTREIQQQGAQKFAALVSRAPLLWYVQGDADKENPEEETWLLTLATDSPTFPLLLQARQKTLRLTCKVHRMENRQPQITNIQFLAVEKGENDFASLPTLIRLTEDEPESTPIPPEFIKRLQELRSERKQARHKLDASNQNYRQGWEEVLNFQRDLIEKNQYWVKYTEHNYREGASKVTFSLDKTDARNSERSIIPYEEFQPLARESRQETLKIFAALPDEANVQRGQVLEGRLEEFQGGNGKMTISFEQLKAGRLSQTGYLHYDAIGDIWQVRRQQQAIDDLNRGRALNRWLADFFFDATKARPAKITTHLQPADLLSGTCNPGQIAAIEAALAAPDLLLIQGPPGTGKTTVIAEICYQVARNGGRTLIASQSNLAVDNALSRLVHSPHIRALRVASNTNAVEEEGRDFIDGQIVQTWLNNTVRDCDTKLQNRTQNIALLKKLLNAHTRFSQYCARETKGEKRQVTLQNKIRLIKDEMQGIEQAMSMHQSSEEHSIFIYNGLKDILDGKIDKNGTDINKVLQDVFQYLAEAGDRKKFIQDINNSLQLMKQLDLALPSEKHLLQSAIQLKTIMRTHNHIWEQNTRLIDQIEQGIPEFSNLEQQQKQADSMLQKNKENLRQIRKQMDVYESRRQSLIADKQTIKQAIEALSLIPQQGNGSIALIIHRCIVAEVPEPDAFQRLNPEAIFSKEVMTAAKRDFTMFSNIWNTAGKDLKEYLQHTIEEGRVYNQANAKLLQLRQRFFDLLQNHPELHQELVSIQTNQYTPPQNSTEFSQCITQIEKNIERINELCTAFIKKVMGLLYKQELQQLLAGTRDFLLAAQKTQNDIPQLLTNAHTAFAQHTAGKLLSALQQWMKEQQQAIDAAGQNTVQQAKQYEQAGREIGQIITKNEEQFVQAKNALHEMQRKLSSTVQNLSTRPDIPRALRQIAQQDATNPSSLQEHLPRYQSWVSDIQHLRELVQTLWSTLQTAKDTLQKQLAQDQQELTQQKERLNELTLERNKLEQSLQQAKSSLEAEREWWRQLWEEIPENVRPPAPAEGIFSPPFLKAVREQFTSWQSELDKEEHFAQRYGRLLTDWVQALQGMSESEREKIKGVYLKNANVIGTTCLQAFNLPRSKTLAKFDMVIIDEVSKATPPELLLPALLGKKLVLIGDQHQLPPMIDDKTWDQIAEDSGNNYRFLNTTSYFEQRYNEAPDTIKRMLVTQYRMHPDIMAAINQFYERPLECGLNQPDLERDPQLESALVRKDKHLLWVTTPLVERLPRRSQQLVAQNRASRQQVFTLRSATKSFGEERNGTSYANQREVEIIKQICEEFQHIWALKKAKGAEPKEIGVITFYGAQTQRLQQALLAKDGKSRFDALKIRIGTVDSFQGMEREIIIVSMVRNNAQGDIGFAKRDERINVAFSRAQQLLIIVGCHDLFCQQGKAAERYRNVSNIVKNLGDFIDISCT